MARGKQWLVPFSYLDSRRGAQGYQHNGLVSAGLRKYWYPRTPRSDRVRKGTQWNKRDVPREVTTSKMVQEWRARSRTHVLQIARVSRKRITPKSPYK